MKLKKDLIAILIVTLIGLLMFFKIPLKGQFPVPGDLLVSFFFPYHSGEWDGYNPWTTRKELLSADAVRQIYIWKELAMSMFKSGDIPLWNPYTFSGQPFLANFQSSVFYPLNALFFIFNSRLAWVILIILQPVLAGIFCYFFCRSLKISYKGSVFASSAFMYSSYLITWLENGNIGHSYIFLPLSLLSCQLYFKHKKYRYILLGIISLCMSILAGHPQTAIYIYTTFFAFWIFKWITIQKLKSDLVILIFIAFSSLGLCAVQLIPTIAFYKQSPVSLEFSKSVFDQFLIPYQNLITFLVPDFFGHPATNNFWSQNYGDFTPYFGVIPFILATWAIISVKKEKFILFGLIIGTLFFLASISSPISYLIKVLEIPILDSTSSARFISVTIFILAVFSGFGFDSFLKTLLTRNHGSKKLFVLIFLFGILFISLWLLTTYFKLNHSVPQEINKNFSVSQRNLILPTFIFITFSLALLFLKIVKGRPQNQNLLLTSEIPWILKPRMKRREKHAFELFESEPIRSKLTVKGPEGLSIGSLYPNVLTILTFSLTVFGGLYFTNKYLPSASLNFIFPEHKIFSYIQNNAGINRYQGFGTALVDRNFPAAYRTYTVEGYDTLRLERYAQLLASSFYGYVPKSYPRSDATLPPEKSDFRNRMMDLLGVRYLVDKVDDPKTDQDWHYERYTPDKIKGIWQNGKFQAYVRETALPRYFLTDKYLVEADDKKIIEKIYQKDFDLKTLLLEETPGAKIAEDKQLNYEISLIKYKPNEIVFKINSNKNALLFLSDSFDPDWEVFINGIKSKILRADYALRAVSVPEGQSEIQFVYRPLSFTAGVATSFITLCLLIIIGFFGKYKKIFK